LSALPGIHVLRCLSEKQDVDGRDIRREDGASRLLPGHNDMGDNRLYLPAIVTRSRIIRWPWLVLDSHLRTEPLSQRLLVGVCRLMLCIEFDGRAKIL